MTINNLVVEIDQTYINENEGIVTNSTIESVAHINRIATVIEAPSFTTVKAGDKVVCHHNVFVEKNTLKGRRHSDYHFKDKTYLVPFELVYAYIREGEFHALDPFCFIRPIKKEDEEVEGIILNTDLQNSYKLRHSNVGEVAYTNKMLSSMGIEVGDKVAFKPFTRHEFNINGEILYKMSAIDIVAKL